MKSTIKTTNNNDYVDNNALITCWAAGNWLDREHTAAQQKGSLKNTPHRQ